MYENTGYTTYTCRGSLLCMMYRRESFLSIVGSSLPGDSGQLQCDGEKECSDSGVVLPLAVGQSAAAGDFDNVGAPRVSSGALGPE